MEQQVREAGKGNYAYSTARVKARKSSLLGPDTYPRLLNMELPQIALFIAEGQYRREVDELSARMSGVDLLESATYLNLARTYHSILNFTKGELRGMVRRFLNRWDVLNLKTVLRGKSYGASWEELQDEIIPAGALDTAFFQGLYSENGAGEISARFEKSGAPEYRKVLHSVLGAGTPDQSDIENALDREYYRLLLRSIEATDKAHSLFRDYIRVEIDTVNLKTLFKLRSDDDTPDNPGQFLIEGGHELSIAELARLSATDSYDKFLGELATHRIFEQVREQAEHALKTQSLNDVLQALDNYLLGRARRFSHMYPLSVLPIIDYLLRKKNEVDNLRKIARGKQGGLPVDVIRQLLLL